MQGFEDPFNRRGYPWETQDRGLLQFYRNLAHLRAESDTLSHGGLRFLHSTGALLQYERKSGHARYLVLVNRGFKEEHTYVDAIYAVDMLTNVEFDHANSNGVRISVPPETAYILRCFGTC